MLAVGRGRGRVGRMHPSVNPFVPKPGTPFQWLPMENPRESDRKLQYLRKAFGRMPNVDAICKSARSGAAQSILALGDRRVADALEIAATSGWTSRARCARPGWTRPSTSSAAASQDEILPWDVIDNGVAKAYFWKELQPQREERLSPHCPELQGCIRCGVCLRRPNPFYALPEKWKGQPQLPFYERRARALRGYSGRLRQKRS